MSILQRIAKIVKSNIFSFIGNNEESSQSAYAYDDYKDYKNASSDNDNQNLNRKKYDSVEIEYYANLEIPCGSCFSDIKKSYRTLLKKYHPDLHLNNSQDRENAEKITLKLNQAFSYFEDKHNRGELQ